MYYIPDEDVWRAVLGQAQGLSDADVVRHAHVSRDNRHRCFNCFTCACLTEAERRKLMPKPQQVKTQR